MREQAQDGSKNAGYVSQDLSSVFLPHLQALGRGTNSAMFGDLKLNLGSLTKRIDQQIYL